MKTIEIVIISCITVRYGAYETKQVQKQEEA